VYDDDCDDRWDDDRDADDDESTVPCPACKGDVYEDSPRCPHCGHYLTDDDATAVRKPWWIIVGTLLVLYIAYRWITG
jgi:hypothetical protein